MKLSRALITITLGLGLTLALLRILWGISTPILAETVGSNLAPTPPSLARQHAPVVITGGLLSELAGSPLDEIFVYAYRGATLIQVPSQIDERETNGRYVAVEDDQLDDNDELVFMAMDSGGWAANPSLDTGGTPITPTYVITLTDPLDEARAWAYVFCSAALSRTFSADYVSYDGGNDRITSPSQYAIGFDATYAFQDYLALGNGDQNLLDRSKLRVEGTVSGYSISANEQDITKTHVYVVDGPVRVTRISTGTYSVLGELDQTVTTLFAYRSLVVQRAEISILGDPIQTTYYRNSMDWNAQAGGMTYYDANTPAGATIDGLADAITITPPSRWNQVTGLAGTVINVSRIPAGLGGDQSTYYKDDDTLDSNDTGDQRSYGDAGLQIDDPNPGTYPTLGHTYFLTGTATNVGATYVDYYDHPLQANVAVFVPRAWISVTAVKDMTSIYPGETATFTLLLTASEGLAAPVALALQGAPSGALVSFQPNPLSPPGNSQLHIATSASTLVGTYVMTVTGTSNQVSSATALTLTINPTLSLGAQPSARTVLPGDTAAYTLSLAASQGFTDPVTLGLQGAPAGTITSFDPNPLGPPDSSQLYITTTASTLVGTYVMTVTGTSNQVSSATALTLTINPTLTLSAQPSTRTALPGAAAVYTLSLSASQGFTGPVTLGLQGAPAEASVSFDPNPLSLPGSSQLHVNVPPSTWIGTYVMTVSATSDQVSSATPLTLTVNPQIALIPQPSVRSALPGATAVYTLSLTASRGFTEPTTLGLQGAPAGAAVSFDPNPITPPGASQLRVNVGASTAAGIYPMTATGTAGVLTATADLTLVVVSAAPDLTLTVSPTARLAKPGQAVSYTVDVAGTSGFSQAVTLTVVGLPAGVGTTWSANPVVPDDFSILTLFIPSKPSFGDHALQVVGSAGTQVVTQDIALTIIPFKVYLPIVLK
jgi:hypothetical protein